MASTYTANLNLEEPARGDQVGTWDTPVNANMTLVDLVAGGIVTVSLGGAGVVLNAAQYSCKTIIFASTLTADVTITFPTSFKKSYEIIHTCTGSSAFIITLQTTVVGGNNICAKPGDPFECINDGTSLRFKNMGMIGSFWEYAGSSVPKWITACAIDPYLPCDGSTFSSASYPALAAVLGSTTLPDRRGTTGYALNGGTGRLTTASGGLDGNTIFASKLTDSVTLGTSNLPSYTPTGTVAVTVNTTNIPTTTTSGGLADGVTLGSFGGLKTFPANPTATGTFTGVNNGGVSDPVPAIGTGFVYGICMIRSA